MRELERVRRERGLESLNRGERRCYSKAVEELSSKMEKRKEKKEK